MRFGKQSKGTTFFLHRKYTIQFQSVEVGMRNFLIMFSAIIYVCMFSAKGVAAQHVTKISAADLVTNGESFFAAGNITSELTRLAQEDGYIGANESFKCIAVSGVPIATVLNQYKNCTPKPKYLISDGGGIDLMGSCPSPVTSSCSIIQSCKTTLQSYLAEMKKDGTKKLLWMIYPDPQNYATLKANQDVWAQVVPTVLNASTDPKVLIVDLRTTWAGHYSEYTTDGIHCTNAGGTATATAFWKAIKDSNFFDTGSAVSVKQPLNIGKATSTFLGQHVSKNKISLSLFLAEPTAISMRITSFSGKTIFTAVKQGRQQGLQTIQFPLTPIASGMYCLEVKTGQLTNASALIMP